MVYVAYLIDYDTNKIYISKSYKDVNILTYLCQILATEYNIGFWIEPKDEV